jgi:GNAT superfamily N-acetyltransferase
VSDPVTVREGRSDEHVAVMRLFEGALLDVDAETVAAGLAADGLLVAEPADRERIVGAMLVDGGHVRAVAVHPNWRRRGVGTALVATAAERFGRLTADFDPRIRGFYESLGFEVSRCDDRLWGVLDGDEVGTGVVEEDRDEDGGDRDEDGGDRSGYGDGGWGGGGYGGEGYGGDGDRNADEKAPE